jgi:hypothetical protein
LQDTQVGKLNSLIPIHQIEMVKTHPPYINYHSARSNQTSHRDDLPHRNPVPICLVEEFWPTQRFQNAPWET